MPEPETTRVARGWRSKTVKIFVPTLVLAMLVVAGVHAYMYLMFSELVVYDRIVLGESEEDAHRLLAENRISCGDFLELRRAQPGQRAYSCQFHDPWRTYALGFYDHAVASKQVTYLPLSAMERTPAVRLALRLRNSWRALITPR